MLLPAAVLMDRWRGGDDARVDAVRLASEYRVDMATLAGSRANWKSRRPRRDLSVPVAVGADHVVGGV